MIYKKDRELERSGSMKSVVSELMRGELQLHKVSDRLKQLYPMNDSQRQRHANTEGFYRGHAAEAVRRFIEEKYEVQLPYLRNSALACPVITSEKGNQIPIIAQYLGGDGISIVGPVAAEVRKRKEGEIYSFERMVPLSPIRQGVVEGVSYGLTMIKKLGNYGEHGKVSVTIDETSRATRSPTMKFNSTYDANAAIAALKEENFYEDLLKTGSRKVECINGRLAELTFNKINSGYDVELSINFIYEMFGNSFGHEAATGITGKLMESHIIPKLNSLGIEYKTLWLAGGEDGDLRPAVRNVRGRNVSGTLFLPGEYLMREFEVRETVNGERKVMMPGISISEFCEMHDSKYHRWTDFQGANSHTGMENEILDALFRAIRPASPAFVSSVINVEARETERRNVRGVEYTLSIRNFEWGVEGIRTQQRNECEAIIGIDAHDQGISAAKVAGLTVSVLMAGGLNQHRLAHTGSLHETKKEIVK